MHKKISLLGIVFFLFIIWIIYLANSGLNSIFFDFVKTIPFGDKLGHFILFGSLTFFATIILKFRTFSIGKFHIYYGFTFVSAFVIIEEFSQIFIASRTFDLLDLSADFIGIITATILAYIIQKQNYFSLK